MLTLDQLNAAVPRAGRALAALYLAPINAALSKFVADKPHVVAAFLANTAHESANFHRVEEGLNYSAERLCVVFPKRFPDADVAERYARQPERIANRAYAGKNGNGDEQSGDGWAYRGRGLIQVTGRGNYTACSVVLFGYASRLLTEPDLLLEPDHAAASAGWYWHSHGCDELADRGDRESLCRRINGELNGFEDREALYHAAMEVLA